MADAISERTVLEWADLYLYGWSNHTIGLAYRVAASTVRKKLIAEGVSMRAASNPHPKRSWDDKLDSAFDAWDGLPMSSQDIAKAVGTTPNNIDKLLREALTNLSRHPAIRQLGNEYDLPAMLDVSLSWADR